MAAHRGITVADVPNLFFLLGPNTGLGTYSMVFMIESQIRYVADAIAAVDKAGRRRWRRPAPPRTGSTTKLQDDLAGSVWNTGGCRSWYLDEHGVNRSLWSGLTSQYWLATREFKPAEYKFSGVACLAVARALGATRQHNMLCSRRLSHPRGSVGSGAVGKPL